MAFVHGKGTGVLVDEFDLSSYFNSSDSAKTVDADEVTTFGKDDKVYLAGLEDGTLSLGGFYDGATDAVAEVLEAALAADPIVSVGVAGLATLGNPATLLQAIETSYGVSSGLAPVEVSASMQAKSGLRHGGKVAHALQERTTTFNGASIDDLASSAFGAVAHLHLTALTGTDIDVRLQHSADDAVWADLAAWTGATVGAQRTVATGTVNRYIRVIVDGGTFTAATFAVTYARNRR